MSCCCNNNNDHSSCGCRKSMPIILVIVALLAVFGAYKFITKPDERTTIERVGDAVKALPDGVEEAQKQLEDKSAADKIGDKVKELVK